MIPFEERETTITFYQGDEFIKIYTCDTTMLHKLDKMVESSPNGYKVIRQDADSKTYMMRFKLLSFRNSVTEGQKLAGLKSWEKRKAQSKQNEPNESK